MARDGVELGVIIMALIGQANVIQLVMLCGRLDRPVDLADGKTLAPIVSPEGLSNAAQQFSKGSVRFDLQTGRNHARERTGGVLEGRLRTVQDRQADHKLITPLRPGKIERQGTDNHMEGAGLILFGQNTQLLIEVSR